MGKTLADSGRTRTMIGDLCLGALATTNAIRPSQRIVRIVSKVFVSAWKQLARGVMHVLDVFRCNGNLWSNIVLPHRAQDTLVRIAIVSRVYDVDVIPDDVGREAAAIAACYARGPGWMPEHEMFAIRPSPLPSMLVFP
jgi:hypothetical protein